MSIQVLETPRLLLREFNLNDASFILKLVNSEGWLKYIGDRNVKDEESARQYLTDGPLTSYSKNGFGLWAVQRKEDQALMGMCGLLKRDSLEGVDLGFAFLPEFCRQQYGFEIAGATIGFARDVLGLPEILAITVPTNLPSITLLTKLGFSFLRSQEQNGERLLVFASRSVEPRIPELERLVEKFYRVFTNKYNAPDVSVIRDLFIPTGLVVKNVGGHTEAYSLSAFIEPRQKMLTDGTLTDFEEREISARSESFGTIAHRMSLYSKSGRLKGKAFATFGVKSMQFLKTPDGWKISSVAWDDENP